MAKKPKADDERVEVIVAARGVKYDGEDVAIGERLRMLAHEAADLVAARCAYYPKVA